MRILLLLIIFTAGCAGIDPEPVHEILQEPVVEAIGVNDQAHRDVADAAAEAWNSQARILAVASFDGVPAGFEENRWLALFENAEFRPAAGNGTMWSYSYALDTPANDAVDIVTDAAGMAPVRLGYVVVVDDSGSIVDAFETMDDDEGIPPFDWLTDAMSSSEAAQSLEGDIVRHADYAEWAAGILAMGFVGDGPEWLFILETVSTVNEVIVDAVTGEVLEVASFDK